MKFYLYIILGNIYDMNAKEELEIHETIAELMILSNRLVKIYDI